MAESHLYPSTPDRYTYQYQDDYDDVWEAISQPMGRFVFLDACSVGKPLKNPTYFFMEDIEDVVTVQLDGAITTETQITLDTTAYLQVGDMLRVHGVAGKTEWMQVLTIVDTTDITVTRGIGDTDQESHADNTVFQIVRAQSEGSEKDTFEFKKDIRRENYTGIISHSVGLSRSAMAGKPRGYAMAELDRQEAEKLTQIKGELEDMLLYGPGQARAAATTGMMKGIRPTIVDRAGSNYNTDAVTWGYSLLDDRINSLAQIGMIKDTSRLICFCTSSMYSAAGYWGSSAVRTTRSEMTYGFETQMVHSTLGLEVPLVWGYSAIPGEFMLIDLSRFEYNFLGGNSLIRYRQPMGIVLQDYEGRRLVMEAGCKLRYADRAHWLQTNVTVPS
jgi:hypothetical protein